MLLIVLVSRAAQEGGLHAQQSSSPGARVEGAFYYLVGVSIVEVMR